jgi:hypothetical protein
MMCILAKEKQVAARKRIEARRIADFRTSVAAGMREELLRSEGIESMERSSWRRDNKRGNLTEINNTVTHDGLFAQPTKERSI